MFPEVNKALEFFKNPTTTIHLRELGRQIGFLQQEPKISKNLGKTKSRGRAKPKQFQTIKLSLLHNLFN